MKVITSAALAFFFFIAPVGFANAEDGQWQQLYNESEKLFLQGKYAPSLEKAKEAQAFAEKTHGVESRETAMSISMISVVLQTTGKADQAEVLIKQAMAMREKVLGTEHADYAESLNNLAVLYRAQGRYLESGPLDIRALAIREKLLGPDHQDVANSLINIGSSYSTLGKFSQGEPYFQRAIAILEKKFGAKDAKLTGALNNLADLYRKQGKYGQAEALQLRAIAIMEASYGLEHPYVALFNNNLALLYFEKGEYLKAKNLFQNSLALFLKTLGDKHPIVATTLSNISNIEFKQGQYAQAEKTALQAVAIREAALGQNHPDVAAGLSNLGLFYYEQSKFSEAEVMHQKALSIFEKAFNPSHPDVGQSLNNIALIYSRQGRHEQALPLLIRALTIRKKAFGNENVNVAITLNNLADAYMGIDNFKESELASKNAISIWEKELGPDYPEIAAAAGSLAVMYISQKRYADAESLLLRAIRITEKSQGSGHPRVGINLGYLADIYFLQNQYTKAGPTYERSLSILKAALGDDHYQTAPALTRLSALYLQQGRHKEALDASRRATNILRRRYVASEQNASNGKLTEQKSNSSAFVTHLSTLGPLMQKTADADALASEGFEVAQLARASSVGQSVAQMATRFAKGGDALAELVRSQQDMREKVQGFNTLLLNTLSLADEKRDAEGEQKLRQDIAALNLKLDEQNASINQRFPKYQALISQEPVSAAETQKLLAADEAMIVYTVENTGVFVWVLTKANISFHPLAVNAEDIRKQVQFLRSKLVPNAAGQLSKMTPATSRRLSQEIFAPLESSLIGIKHILLVPDGALQSLPFGVLSSIKEGESGWLAKRYAFSVLPSVSALRALRLFSQNETGKLAFAGFGNPVLSADSGVTRSLGLGQVFKTRSLATGDNAANNGLADVEALRSAPSLPETADELHAISAVLNGSSEALFLGPQATETTVKQTNLADYRFLAFATHGVMAGELSGVIEPGLVLTPPKVASAQDDGYLSASEVAQLKLNAEWVLLSACNTAAPDGTPGAEGLSGLAKAFFYAGTRSLLVSNWPVASDATKILITDTVSTYAKTPTIGKAEAIKQAMGRMMEKPEYAHPFYWGAFVVVGE